MSDYYYVNYRLENRTSWGRIMKNLSSTVLVICVGSQSVASGLSEPEIISPLIALNVPCETTYKATEADYKRALNHFTLAVGQSGAVAEKSASNMVISHLAARKQTCNANAKAATDNSENLFVMDWTV